MTLHVTVYTLLEALGVVFLRLLNLSIAAGVVMLLVMAIRRLFPHMPKWLRCLLWALPALRLLPLPFSLSNPFSLAPAAETVYEARTVSGGNAVPVLNSGWEAVDNAVNPALERSFTGLAGTAAAVTEKARDFTPASFFGVVWAAGCAALLAYLLFSFLRFRRRVREAAPLEKGVYLCDAVSAPFILGVLRPKIYLPSALDAARYPAILAHERAHLKRKDHWWKPLGFLLLAAHWFNPLAWAAYALLCRDIELACDEKVIKAADADERKAYSEALLACGAPARPVTACPLAFGEVGVKARIRNVLSYKKPAVWVAVAAVLAASVTAFCFLTDRPAMWVNQWRSVYVSDKVYLDPVISPEKASRQTPFRLILDDENHMLRQFEQTDKDNPVVTRDLGPADIGGEYLGGTDLWAIAREYAPAQYRNSQPQKCPGVMTVNEGFTSYHVLFRPRGNVFFYARFSHNSAGEPVLESLCRMKRTGVYKREEQGNRWTLTVPVEGVRYLSVSGGFGNYVTCCHHENDEGTPLTFPAGERVFLRGIESLGDVGDLTVSAYDSGHELIHSFHVPRHAGDDAYTDPYGWEIARLGRSLSVSEGAAMKFLTNWFTTDADGRYTRLTEQGMDEDAFEAYLARARHLVTDRYFSAFQMNRGYYAYDRLAAENGLSYTVRGVRLRKTGDGQYSFTVYLREKGRGYDDHAEGWIRVADGKIDGIRVTGGTLNDDAPSHGDTPTSAYEEATTSRDSAEWTTAVPPETDNGTESDTTTGTTRAKKSPPPRRDREKGRPFFVAIHVRPRDGRRAALRAR